MTQRIWKKAFWLIAAAGLLALLVYGFMPTPVEVHTVQPTVGALAITVDDDGETRIREKYVLLAPVSGKMLRVHLDAGDPVTQGETEVARIQPSDPSLLDARTRGEAEARVRVAVANDAQVSTAVDRARQALELAKKDYQRVKDLMSRQAISQAEFDSKEHAFRLANADLRSAESARRVAQYEIDQAEAAVRYIRSAFDPKDEQLFRLIAPIHGKVLEIYREHSGVVNAGTPIARIGDPKDLEIQIDVLSSDAVKIRPGNEVLIEHWGGPHVLHAVVRLVEPSAFLKVSALGVEEKRVNVIADFIDPYDRRDTLGDGFRIEAKIIVERTPETSLKVPTGVLLRQSEDWYVFRVENGTAQQRSVRVGRTNGLETEVLEGLDTDDVLILHPTDSIRSDLKVLAVPD